jgi:hypothetical protein
LINSLAKFNDDISRQREEFSVSLRNKKRQQNIHTKRVLRAKIVQEAFAEQFLSDQFKVLSSSEAVKDYFKLKHPYLCDFESSLVSISWKLILSEKPTSSLVPSFGIKLIGKQFKRYFQRSQLPPPFPGLQQ